MDWANAMIDSGVTGVPPSDQAPDHRPRSNDSDYTTTESDSGRLSPAGLAVTFLSPLAGTDGPCFWSTGDRGCTAVAAANSAANTTGSARWAAVEAGRRGGRAL